ncbi:hypothetical protein [Litchfieldella xinjiangensis]|uniref:hypothetical protein n=1 Tax=Litchfieldella xinjiangensis TaxID=1166948 RepID=UPI0005BC3D56|nr:hypothetical protein [Halomonas xinjiangensis]
MDTQRHSAVSAPSFLNAMKATWACRTVVTSRREEDDGPMSTEQAANARREAEYVARRNGIKAPLLQLWKVEA